jgi:hypothetical protein
VKIREAIPVLGAAFLTLLCQGCHNPPKDVINKALASTNAVFRTIVWRGPDIPLTQAETEKIKNIVARFNKRSNVRVANDILSAPYGHFILGDSIFGWLGSTLYIHRSNTDRYFIIEDAALGDMWDAFQKAESGSSHEYPSREKWQEILLVLEKSKP